MDTFLRPKGLNALDLEIERLVNQLGNTNPVDKDYKTISDNLKALCEAREKKNDRVISAETLVSVGANLIGLLVILNFEKTGVITSKALSFLWRGKA